MKRKNTLITVLCALFSLISLPFVLLILAVMYLVAGAFRLLPLALVFVVVALILRWLGMPPFAG